jgi:hypothetical protein
MIPHLVYSQLVILVLLWLCLMLQHLWPSPSDGAPKTPTQPMRPKHKHSAEPKLFAGLTHKPSCALCEQESGERAPAPPRRPDPIPSANRRPRTVDTSMHFCPHTDCAYRGWLGLNNLRANGHPSGAHWRQFHCTACQGYFLGFCRKFCSAGHDGAVTPCVFHGFLPPSPEECCHAIHGNVATQSRGFLPPSPEDFCHPVHGMLPPSERSDAGLYE